MGIGHNTIITSNYTTRTVFSTDINIRIGVHYHAVVYSWNTTNNDIAAYIPRGMAPYHGTWIYTCNTPNPTCKAAFYIYTSA